MTDDRKAFEAVYGKIAAITPTRETAWLCFNAALNLALHDSLQLSRLTDAVEAWVQYLGGPGDGADDAGLEQRLMQELRDAVEYAKRPTV